MATFAPNNALVPTEIGTVNSTSQVTYFVQSRCPVFILKHFMLRKGDILIKIANLQTICIQPMNRHETVTIHPYPQ